MAFLIRALAALLASTTRHVVLGCSCAPHGDTPTEQAESIRTQSDWIDFYAIATFVNETQYSVDEFWGSDDDDPYETTHQNTTFILKEIVYNPSGELPSTIEIKSDGTMEYRAFTETTCCLCGLSFSPQQMGQDYLLPMSHDSLSSCSIICSPDEGTFCEELVEELRSDIAIADA